MTTNENVDTDLLSELVEEKLDRDGLSLRDAAEKIGISAPTLQRMGSGHVPTTSTLLKLVKWLGMSVDDLCQSRKLKRDTMVQIEVHLRADPKLDKKGASAIANMVRAVYDEYTKSRKSK